MPDPADIGPDAKEVTPEETEGVEVSAHSADEDEELPACIVFLPN